MNTKEIIIPDGWIIDKQEGNKLILKEDNPKLNTWENCFDKLNSKHILGYINQDSIFTHFFPGAEANLLNTKAFPEDYAESMLALYQLLVCYKAWVGDWKPNWIESHIKYCIYVRGEEIIRGNFTSTYNLLAFPTLDIRDKFLETFKDLLEQAKPLL
jgi:hypothetical protein